MDKNEIKKYYIKWTKNDIVDLEDTGITTIFIEVNSKGEVMREVGLDEKGITVHKCPSENYKHGKYGIFDLVKIDTTKLRNDITKPEFEEFFNKVSGEL